MAGLLLSGKNPWEQQHSDVSLQQEFGMLCRFDLEGTQLCTAWLTVAAARSHDPSACAGR